MMKKNTLLVVLAALLLALAVPLVLYASTAEVTFTNWFTSTDTGDNTGESGSNTYTAHGGTVAYAGSTPVVDFYSVTGTDSTGRLEIMTENGTNTTVSTLHTNGSTGLHVNSTVGFAADSYIAIQDNSSQKFEVNQVESVGVGVLILERVSTYAYKVGTMVKELAAKYSVPIGSATVTTPATLVGERGEAMAWHANGSATVRINNISGHYEK